MSRRSKIVRLHGITMLGLLSVVAGYAGTIEIGGPSGLTANYINQGAGAVCAAGAGNCVAGSTTGYVERNYDSILFSGATNNSGATTPVPFTGYTQTGGEASGLTATGGATFAMLSDGQAVSGVSNNYWGSNGINGASDSIVVPIGVFGATDVWTMLDNQWGTMGGNDTTVTFNFGTSANQTTGLTSVAVALTNNNGTASNGELRAAMSCSTTPGTECSPTTNPRGTTASGTTINGVTVNEGVVFSTFLYTNATGVFYGGSAGKVRLDDQQFLLPSADSNLWLVSMTVTENNANSPQSAALLGGGALPSETALSAITVDFNSSSVATPEPTTILLLFSGLGAIGLRRLRRK